MALMSLQYPRDVVPFATTEKLHDPSYQTIALVM
jgi:hypothetical protein